MRYAALALAVVAPLLVVATAGSASAAGIDTFQKLQDAVTAGGSTATTVTLGGDITHNSGGLVLPANADLTLDLAGHALTLVGSTGQAGIGVDSASSLRIEDTSPGGAGTVHVNGGDFAAGIGGGGAAGGGGVIIDGGSVTATGGNDTSISGNVSGGAGIGGGGGSIGGGSGPVTIGSGAMVTVTGGSHSNSTVGSNGGTPAGAVTNSGTLTLGSNQTNYGGMVNTSTGVIHVKVRMAGGVTTNDGAIIIDNSVANYNSVIDFSPFGAATVNHHAYLVGYSTDPGGDPAQVFASSFAAAHSTVTDKPRLKTPPTGEQWYSDPTSCTAQVVDTDTDLGSVFGHRTASPDSYNPNSPTPTTPVPNVALYARDTATVRFDSMNGTNGSPTPGAQTVLEGCPVAQPTAPTKAHYTFTGWYTAPSGGDRWAFGTDPVSADMTLYAHWVARHHYSCDGHRATIVGTPGPDHLTGTTGRDVIVAFGGNDVIRSRGGNDIICAGAGNDTVHAGTGADRVVGGAGNDRLYGGSGPDRLAGSAGDDRLWGQRGADRLFGAVGVTLGGLTARRAMTNDVLYGGRGPDVLYGNAYLDRFHGGPGRDHIHKIRNHHQHKSNHSG